MKPTQINGEPRLDLSAFPGAKVSLRKVYAERDKDSVLVLAHVTNKTADFGMVPKGKLAEIKRGAIGKLPLRRLYHKCLKIEGQIVMVLSDRPIGKDVSPDTQMGLVSADGGHITLKIEELRAVLHGL